MPKKVTVNSPRNSNPRQAGSLTSLAGFHSIPFSFTRRSSGALEALLPWSPAVKGMAEAEKYR